MNSRRAAHNGKGNVNHQETSIPTNGNRQTSIWIAGIALLIMGGFLFLLIWTGDGHGMPIRHYDQLHVGMTGDEVIAVAGTPNHIRRHQDGTQTWTYSRFTFCHIQVLIGDDEKVILHDHDH
ncbi:MAG: outer membrane protein assembly factor BamE [Planctomycetales bacterium]